MNKKANVPVEIVRAVIRVLRQRDGAPLHLRWLRQEVGVIFHKPPISERIIRRAILEAIENPDYAAPIGSSQRGYYWITEGMGLAEAVRDLRSRVRELNARAEMLSHNYVQAKRGKAQTDMFVKGGKP